MYREPSVVSVDDLFYDGVPKLVLFRLSYFLHIIGITVGLLGLERFVAELLQIVTLTVIDVLVGSISCNFRMEREIIYVFIHESYTISVGLLAAVTIIGLRGVTTFVEFRIVLQTDSD